MTRGFERAADSGEHFDLVIVGAGFAGVTTAYTYLKEKARRSRVLIFDNHAMFGGEARHNEFDVDGLSGFGRRKARTAAVWPLEEAKKIEMYSHLWDELGLPNDFEWQEAKNSDLKIPEDIYTPMHIAWEKDRPRLVH